MDDTQANSKPAVASQAAGPLPYRWVVLGVTTLAQTSVSVLSQAAAPLAPFIQGDYSLSRAQVGLLTLAVGCGSYFTLVLSGRLIDRLGERAMMLASGVIAGAFALAMITAGGFIGALTLLALMGVGTAVATPAGSKAVMSWFEVRVRGTAMGVRQVGIPLGGMIASLALPSLALIVGWRGAVAFGGIFAVLGAVICFAFYREPPRQAARAVSIGPAMSFGKIIGNKNLWFISVYAVAMLAAQFTFSLYLVVFAHERLGLSVVASGSLLALAQAVAVGSRIGWGVVSDRLLGGDRMRAMAIIAVIAGASSIVFSFLHAGVPLWTVAIMTIFLGASAIGWNGLYVTSVSELAGQEAAGTALGVSLTVSQIGLFVGPPLFGLIADHSGSYQPAWLALGFFILVGTLPIHLVSRAKQAQT